MPTQFTLKDADGNVRQYETTPHGAAEGMKVMWQLIALGAEPVARLADQALKSEQVVPKLVEAMKGGAGGSVIELATQLDLAAAGADVKRSITTMKMEDLTHELLRHTIREGQSLADKGAFNLAYTANYGELIRALWEVVKINRFLSLLGM